MNEPGTHKLTEAMKGHEPAPIDANDHDHGPAGPKGHGPTPADAAEESRREEEARPAPVLDRDRKLTEIGRGEQTHG